MTIHEEEAQVSHGKDAKVALDQRVFGVCSGDQIRHRGCGGGDDSEVRI